MTVNLFSAVPITLKPLTRRALATQAAKKPEAPVTRAFAGEITADIVLLFINTKYEGSVRTLYISP